MDDVRSRARALYDVLVPLWPDGGSALHYGDCFQLLVAVILSAQCTDEQVNAVTPALFGLFPDAEALAEADLTTVERLVHSTGFYHAKARNIIATAGALVRDHRSTVPDTIEALVTLPGVGRKTANLVVSVCYGKPGIVVDTHVLRTARRLALAPTEDPAISERMIGHLLPESKWTAFSYALNRHGKHVCTARKPHCTTCQVSGLCPSRQDTYESVPG